MLSPERKPRQSTRSSSTPQFWNSTNPRTISWWWVWLPSALSPRWKSQGRSSCSGLVPPTSTRNWWWLLKIIIWINCQSILLLSQSPITKSSLIRLCLIPANLRSLPLVSSRNRRAGTTLSWISTCWTNFTISPLNWLAIVMKLRRRAFGKGARKVCRSISICLVF